MKIVIFSGGTGSKQLQTGLYEVFGKTVLDYTVITNLADNGLSTGAVRKVMDGKIMGPSDLRKNQMLRADLEAVYHSRTLKFLDKRITMKAHDVKAFLLSSIDDLDENEETRKTLEDGVNTFFDQPKALQIDYDDFSISNIIYAGLAKKHNYSLDTAGLLFEKILNIPKDSVISNTDESMYLVATTESGYEIMDEGDIVSWNNPNDKIVSCHFIDVNGKPIEPVMSKKSLDIIAQADMIIFSTGTQWSSLIPTYISKGFKEAIESSKAQKYLVMNAFEDKDMKGVTGDDILNILDNYLPLKDINIISASDGAPSLIPTVYDAIKAPLLGHKKKAHAPIRLVLCIFDHYFKEYLKNDIQVFDYDDTLVARGEEHSLISNSNILLFNHIEDKEVWLCTGNTPKVLKSKFSDIDVLADGGVNLYHIDSNGEAIFSSCLDEKFVFTNIEIDDIIKSITGVGIDISKIQIRGKVMISIKPIDPAYRTPIAFLLSKLFSDYTVKQTGRTTIDMHKPGLSKAIAVDKCFNSQFTFIGDEWYEGGNDYDMSLIPSCDFLKIKSVKDTNMYLRILTRAIV